MDSDKVQGFTLIEVVIVMVLSGILFVVISVFIARPISAYKNVTLRAELVDAADMALQRMARDIQSAVPNSVRVKQTGSQIAVEMLNVVEGMRYRATPPGSYLNFTSTNTEFKVIGQFRYALTNPNCAANNCRLVVYNTGANTGGSMPSDNPAPGANVYSTEAAPACAPSESGCLPPPGSVTITPVGSTVTLSNPAGSNSGNITISPAVQFAFPSARQRIQIVDTPITYICDTSLNQITRYANYTITPIQPTDPLVSPLNSATAAQLTKDVSACHFSYSPGTAKRNGIITMSITLSNGGEMITLMRQTRVSNTS